MIRTFTILAMLLASASAFAGVTVECWDGDCLHKGWTITVHHSNRFMDVSCRHADCAANGWTAQGNAWAGTMTTCKEGGCFASGWIETDRFNRVLREISCEQRDDVNSCLHFGWTTYERNVAYQTTCKDDDCAANGWETVLPGYGARKAECLEGGCFVGGWTETP